MKIGWRLRIAWLLFLLFLIVGCQGNSQDDELNGRITLWHSWSEEDAVVLEEALAQFEEIHPLINQGTMVRDQLCLLAKIVGLGN